MYRIKKNGYTNARKTEYNGVLYDSKFEAKYAMDLDLRLKAKDIQAWKRQKKIPLIVNGFLVANYFIDFVIYHNNQMVEFVEIKGHATPVWKLKWKIFEALYANKPWATLTVIKQKDNFTLRKIKKVT